MQLIGLCGDNALRTPVMLLTDLVDYFYAVYLIASDMERPTSFEIVIQRCSSIQAALNFAIPLAERPCLSFNYGRANTPTSSDVDSDAGAPLDFCSRYL